MKHEFGKGQPDYKGMAAVARDNLNNKQYYSGIEDVKHINPATGEACTGTLVIAFPSWRDALGSEAMKVGGGVSGTCIRCGGSGFVNQHKKIG